MILWREKFIATSVHFAVTLVLAGIAAGLIFLVWYPDPFDDMIGGTELFLLVVGCDLALGPLLSLVVFDSRKSRRQLIFDYSVISVLQIGALVYGVLVVADSRPAYITFSGDRLEVVAAGTLKPKELQAARDPQFRTVPWTGPKFVAVVIPAADMNDAIFEALAGNEEQLRPKFYVTWQSQIEKIRQKAQTLDVLEAKHPASKQLVQQALRGGGVPVERLRWLPVRHMKGFWTALVDTDTGEPVAWIPLDPY